MEANTVQKKRKKKHMLKKYLRKIGFSFNHRVPVQSASGGVFGIYIHQRKVVLRHSQICITLFPCIANMLVSTMKRLQLLQLLHNFSPSTFGY